MGEGGGLRVLAVGPAAQPLFIVAVHVVQPCSRHPRQRGLAHSRLGKPARRRGVCPWQPRRVRAGRRSSRAAPPLASRRSRSACSAFRSGSNARVSQSSHRCGGLPPGPQSALVPAFHRPSVNSLPQSPHTGRRASRSAASCAWRRRVPSTRRARPATRRGRRTRPGGCVGTRGRSARTRLRPGRGLARQFRRGGRAIDIFPLLMWRPSSARCQLQGAGRAGATLRPVREPGSIVSGG